jgi:hypothetical protein
MSKLAHLRLHRERRAAGLKCYTVVLNEVDLEHLLGERWTAVAQQRGSFRRGGGA